MASLPALGAGDEYEIPDGIDLVHADPKTVNWRKQEFVRLGFSMGEAQTLAVRREAELRDIERWLGQGATHAQVLLIVAPLIELPETAYGRDLVERVAAYTEPEAA